MKKTLIALAALAATGAFAQSSVSIWGTVDASVNFISADTAASGNQSATRMNNSQLGSSKLGFSGLEDLGGGLSAKFWLEAGLGNDSGVGKGTVSDNQATGGCTVANVTLLNATKQSASLPTGTTACSTNGAQGLVFQRRSYVGLVGGFGELKLGREYQNTFIGVQAAADPFGTNGPADSTQMQLMLGLKGSIPTTTNASNMITYITPVMGGFFANLQTWMGENVGGASTSNDGNGYSVTGTYAAGPILVALGAQETKYSITGDYTQQMFSATYDFGVAKVGYTYGHEGIKATTGADTKNDTNLFAVTVPMGAMNLKASYIAGTNNANTTKVDQKGELFGLGVDYSLSKRTKVYATYGSIKNSDGGANYGANSTVGMSTLSANGGTSNVAIGVFHTF